VTSTIERPFGRKFLDDAQHLAHQLGIQGRGRLVEEQKLGLLRQCAGDADALLLAPGQALGIFVNLVRHVHFSQHSCGQFLGRALRHLLHAPWPQGDVLQHSQVRPKIKILKDETHLPPLRRQFTLAEAQYAAAFHALADQLAVQIDVTAVRGLEVIDAAQERRLSRAARPDQRDLAALRQGQIDSAKHLQAAKALVQGFDAKELFRHEGRATLRKDGASLPRPSDVTRDKRRVRDTSSFRHGRRRRGDSPSVG
jgi:hypothetical protein